MCFMIAIAITRLTIIMATISTTQSIQRFVTRTLYFLTLQRVVLKMYGFYCQNTIICCLIIVRYMNIIAPLYLNNLFCQYPIQLYLSKASRHTCLDTFIQLHPDNANTENSIIHKVTHPNYNVLRKCFLIPSFLFRTF